jgi:hypothetical protein
VSLLPAAAQADGCANEQLRAETHSLSLPDCRAYELVTPPFVNLALTAAVHGSSETSAITYFSASGHGGGIQEPNGVQSDYRAARTASGWLTTPLGVPPGELESTRTLDSIVPGAPAVAADGDALLALRPADGSLFEADLYLRRANGSLTEIGPMLPPEAIPPAPTSEGYSEFDIEEEYFAGASSDLSHVFFGLYGVEGRLQPQRQRWWPGDSSILNNQNESLYEYDGVNNARPTLVGVDDEGHQISQCGTGLGANAQHGFTSDRNAVSASGRTVYFTAAAGGCEGVNRNNEIVIGAGPPAQEIFARINGERTVAISEPSIADCAACSTQAPADATFIGASRDGSKVWFVTNQALLPGDNDTTSDLYEYDFDAPAGHRIIQVSGGGPGDPTPGRGAIVEGVGSISEDGSHVYFVAQGVLTTTPDSLGRPAQPGASNLYLYERDGEFPNGRTVFVTELSPADASQWDAGQAAPMETTPDGRFLVFTSTADLTADDTSTAQQVFRYDARSAPGAPAGQLVRVSVGQTGRYVCETSGQTQEGYNCDGNTETAAATVRAPTFAAAQRVDQDPSPAISDDGSTVLFTSSARLTPAAQEDTANVYVYEAGQTFLVSGGRAPAASFVQGLQVSPSGGDILFRTPEALVAQDTNTGGDIYDARIGGGFPAPAPPPACGGEGCQGPLGTPPVAGLPSSATLSGTGNLGPQPARKAGSTPRHRTPAQVRAAGLKRALKLCGRRPRRDRPACERRAKRRYAPGKASNNTNRRAK